MLSLWHLDAYVDKAQPGVRIARTQLSRTFIENELDSFSVAHFSEMLHRKLSPIQIVGLKV